MKVDLKIMPTVLCAGCGEGGLKITPTVLCAGCGEGGFKDNSYQYCVQAVVKVDLKITPTSIVCRLW